MIDDDVLNSDQNQENNRPNDEVAANDKIAERGNHLAGGRYPVLPFSKMSREDDTFSERRKSVSISSVVGKTVNSTGRTRYRRRPSTRPPKA